MKIPNEIVVATYNQGKLKEFVAILGSLGIRLRSLTELNYIEDIIEDGETFEQNAKKKAETIAIALGVPVIADDSGLMVDYLGGKPGVYSARFAGEEKDDYKNNKKLLQLLEGIEWGKRTARFVSAIALAIPDKETMIVRGTVEGMIADTPKGSNGFGYDPIFYVPDYDKTMAELSPNIKNTISHRANALKNLLDEMSRRYDN